jgi:hypothetical protein
VGGERRQREGRKGKWEENREIEGD